MIASKLGSSEVSVKLSECGMGVVYQAKDSRPAREVALELLSRAFTADAERTTRLEREARAPRA